MFVFHIDALLKTMVPTYRGPWPISPIHIQIDSRKIKSGDFFIALRGPRFDGHDFVGQALEAGAVGAMVERHVLEKIQKRYAHAALCGVCNTLQGLKVLAKAHRETLELTNVIAIGGSNGKTSTKTLLNAILERNALTWSTPANENNEIGVSLSLLNIRPEHQWAILELGTNHRGEMKVLMDLVSPEIALLTNIQREHLEGFGNLEGVFEEEMTLLREMPKAHLRVFPDSEISVLREAQAKGWTYITHGKHSPYRCLKRIPQGLRGQQLTLDLSGQRLEVELQFVGKHHAQNALAAATLAHHLGVSRQTIKEGLESARPVSQRMEIKEIEGRWVCDDAYNANPDSTWAALRALDDLLPHSKWILVIGDMLELGEQSDAMHWELGLGIADWRPKALYAFGQKSRQIWKAAQNKGFPAQWGDDFQEAAAWILHHSNPGDGILFKASHGMHLEKIIHYLSKGLSV